MNQETRKVTHFRVPPDLHKMLVTFIRNVPTPPPHWPLGSAIDLYLELQRCEARLEPESEPFEDFATRRRQDTDARHLREKKQHDAEPKGRIVEVDPPTNDERHPSEEPDELPLRKFPSSQDVPPAKLAKSPEESKDG